MDCLKTAVILISMVISLIGASTLRTDTTVSGISSGGAMAVQLHMSFSKDVSGCGIVAGPPYYCAGNLMTASACMAGPLYSFSVPGILSKLKSYQSLGSIDNLTHIRDDGVYIFTGKYDIVARPSTVKLNEDIYSSLGAHIKTNYDMAASHGFPTDNFGKSCAVMNLENYINNCGFNLAYDMLNHLYGETLIKPKFGAQVPLVGQMAVFDQKRFMSPPEALQKGDEPSSDLLEWIAHSLKLYRGNDWEWETSGLVDWIVPTVKKTWRSASVTTRALSYSFDTEGFIYFPSACAQGANCSIHVALHGCQQGKYYVNDVFATKAGYLEVAELNNIIVIFPQVAPSMMLPTNPMGCWDWWGYTSLTSYATKTAPQLAGLKKMIESIHIIRDALVASAK